MTKEEKNDMPSYCAPHGRVRPCGICNRDDAIDRVERNNRVFVDDAMSAVRLTAKTLDTFTTDEVWANMIGSTPDSVEPRAMGPIMVNAKRAGLIEKSTQIRPSTMAACHFRDKTVWISRLR